MTDELSLDAVAVGQLACVVNIDGTIQTGIGTSFSLPIMCGLVTCSWQAVTWFSDKQIIEIVRKSGDRYFHPDNIFGYGILNLWDAYKKEMNNRK